MGDQVANVEVLKLNTPPIARTKDLVPCLLNDAKFLLNLASISEILDLDNVSMMGILSQWRSGNAQPYGIVKQGLDIMVSKESRNATIGNLVEKLKKEPFCYNDAAENVKTKFPRDDTLISYQ